MQMKYVHTQSPFVLVIFGATGDLAHHKLIPSLFSLYKEGKLPQDFFIVGFARRPLSQEAFANSFVQFSDEKEWLSFAAHLYYQQGTFGEMEGYTTLIDVLAGFDKQIGACVARIFYLATPPEHYHTILDFLQTSKLSLGCSVHSSNNTQPDEGQSLTRIAIEKPFGKDLETAKALDKRLAQIFEEKQIFRVDHYLGKETVQNLLIFRFANGIFDPIWNKDFIDHVQITFAEEQGIGNRGVFYDGVGELRDIGQNHLVQLLTAVAMEMPTDFSRDGVRNARAKAIKALQCVVPDDIVRGQYAGYKEEKDIPNDSTTETFIALKTYIDTPRFVGVPFYIRAGKGMKRSEVSISIVFRQTCHILFKEIGCPEEGNVLTFRIQPNEGINLKMIAKGIGELTTLVPVDMHFTYEESYHSKGSDAYQKVLLDILESHQMLFNRSDELESSWEFITNILETFARNEVALHEYATGSWGPKAAQELIEKDGRKWVAE